MIGVGRRAQSWSLEIIIALSVFLVIFVLISVFMFYSPEDSTRALDLESKRIMASLENDYLVESGTISQDGLDELTSMSCEELQDFLAASGEICIHFEDLDGSLIWVNGKTGIGCPGVRLNDNGSMLCGVES